ncbi:universal stress protein [Sphingomonas mali]|uniref:universal stress protein n=1 Tax=Sphingomonas mali TaxID=40682 RepID=UPI00083176FE|nr:universal stress protein [Sphingomonas mali]
MKTLLVLAHDDPGQEARIQLAVDLARRLDAHLTLLDVVILPPPYVDDSVGSAISATIVESEIEQEAANRTKLEARLVHEDVSWDWQERTGDLVGSLCGAAQFADLVIVDRQLEDPITPMRSAIGGVITGAGKPILAVPQDVRKFDDRCAVVGWDGSAAATAALRNAIPLLKLMERVFLVEVATDRADGWAEDAARYLSRHGIHARVERVPQLALGIAHTLIAEAGRHGAGLIVAGGYGHSRLREAVFGGVTRELLRHSPCPLLLSH